MFEMLSPGAAVAAALIAPPGPDTTTALAPLIHAALPASVRVDLLNALERQAAWLAALIQPVLAQAGDTAEADAQLCRDPRDPLDLAARAAHAEIGSALRQTWTPERDGQTQGVPSGATATPMGDRL